MLKKVNVFIFVFCLLFIISLTSCKKTYNVVFKDYDGEILKEEIVSEGQNATAPVNPSRDGYKFIGWDNQYTNISKDTVLIAQYELITQEDMNKEYTVTFKDYDGTILREEVVQEGHNATAPLNPTREGYEFIGWDKEYTNITSDLTVIAQYELINQETYIVTFKNSDGTIIKTEEVKHGKNATEPEMISTDNMAFIGWDNSFLNVKEDVVLVAKYLEVTEGLEYKLNEDLEYELVGFGDVSVEDVVVSPIYNGIKVVGINYTKSNTKVKTITLPYGIEYINESSFSGTKIETIYISSTVNNIEPGAFYKPTSSIKTVIDLNNETYKLVDSSIYSYDMTILILAKGTNKNGQIIVPDTVKEIAANAFNASTGIKEIYIGDSVVKIGDSAFSGCEFLEKIEIGKNVEYIGKYAFSGCKNLDEIKIPEKVKTIEENTFYGCSVAKLVISKGLEEINEMAFNLCKYLKEIIVDDENKFFTSVDNVLFTKDMKKLIKYPGASLTKIYTIPEGVETIGVSAFQNTYLLRTVNFSSTVKCIEKNAFSGLQALESVMLNDGLETIGMNAFNASSDMIEIFIPKSVTHIETNAFGRCRSLTIYCEADSILDTWSESWNPLNRPVVWGYTK